MSFCGRKQQIFELCWNDKFGHSWRNGWFSRSTTVAMKIPGWIKDSYLVCSNSSLDGKVHSTRLFRRSDWLPLETYITIFDFSWTTAHTENRASTKYSTLVLVWVLNSFVWRLSLSNEWMSSLQQPSALNVSNEKFTKLADLKPFLKGINCIFIVLEKGICVV